MKKTTKDQKWMKLHRLYPEASSEALKLGVAVWAAIETAILPTRKTIGTSEIARLTGLSVNTCKKRLDILKVPYATTAAGWRRYDTDLAVESLNSFHILTSSHVD